MRRAAQPFVPHRPPPTTHRLAVFATAHRPPPTGHRLVHCVSTPIRLHSSSVPATAIKTLLISLAYVFLLIAALVIVNIVLSRRTREEREAERLRRRQRKPS